MVSLVVSLVEVSEGVHLLAGIFLGISGVEIFYNLVLWAGLLGVFSV